MKYEIKSTCVRHKKIMIVCSVPWTLNEHIKHNIYALVHHGADITTVCNGFIKIDGVRHINCKIPRRFNIIGDFTAFIRLFFIILIQRPSIIHTYSSKAGLLVQLAAKILGIKKRLHTYTGQLWYNELGIKGSIIKLCDKIISYCCTDLYCDGKNQASFLMLHITKGKKDVNVLGSGSVSGINLEKFRPELLSAKLTEKFKAILKLNVNDKLLLYVGRLSLAKGIEDLLDAMLELHSNLGGKNIKLLLIGPIDLNENGLLEKQKYKQIRGSVIVLGYRRNTQIYYNLCDLVVLPSHREGFPMTILEANACGKPVIGSDIYGIRDAINPGVTGWLVPPKDHQALANVIYTAMNDEKEKLLRSKNAIVFSKKFDVKIFTKLYIQSYT